MLYHDAQLAWQWRAKGMERLPNQSIVILGKSYWAFASELDRLMMLKTSTKGHGSDAPDKLCRIQESISSGLCLSPGSSRERSLNLRQKSPDKTNKIRCPEVSWRTVAD